MMTGIDDGIERSLPELFDISGRTAALTGAAGYLVSAMARALAEAGASVALLDVDFEGVQEVAASIRDDGGKAIAFEVDVTSKRALEQTRESIERELGPVSILINGAGANAPTPFFEISEKEWHHILDVNLTGTMLSCQTFGAGMVERRSGSIVNISSASSGPPLSKAFSYSVAKAGVKNLTQNIARDWGPFGVRVNALRPGFFPTEWSKEHFLTDERIEAIHNHTPMGRFGNPEELLGAVLWLCSDAAAFVTGAEIAVDGGFTAMTI